MHIGARHLLVSATIIEYERPFLVAMYVTSPFIVQRIYSSTGHVQAVCCSTQVVMGAPGSCDILDNNLHFVCVCGISKWFDT